MGGNAILKECYAMMPYKILPHLSTVIVGHSPISTLGPKFTKIACCFQHVHMPFPTPKPNFLPPLLADNYSTSTFTYLGCYIKPHLPSLGVFQILS